MEPREKIGPGEHTEPGEPTEPGEHTEPGEPTEPGEGSLDLRKEGRTREQSTLRRTSEKSTGSTGPFCRKF